MSSLIHLFYIWLFLDVVLQAGRAPPTYVEISPDGHANAATPTCPSVRKTVDNFRIRSKRMTSDRKTRIREEIEAIHEETRSRPRVLSVLEAEFTFGSWWRKVKSEARSRCRRCHADDAEDEEEDEVSSGLDGSGETLGATVSSDLDESGETLGATVSSDLDESGEEAIRAEDSDDLDESGEASSLLESNTSSTDDAEAEGVPSAARLLKAVMRAAVPTPALASCLSLTIDLTQIGIPEVKLVLGLRGEVSYDICTECFTWIIEADIALEWQLNLPMIGGPNIGYNVNGQVKLEELPCNEAEDSSYCSFLHILLPQQSRALESITDKCNSESPFDALTAFFQSLWQSAKAKVSGRKQNFLNQMDEKIKTFETELSHYSPLFKTMTDYVKTPSDRILVATCRWGKAQTRSKFDEADPMCQLEVVAAKQMEVLPNGSLTYPDPYTRVYKPAWGDPRRKTAQCTFSGVAGVLSAMAGRGACKPDNYLCYLDMGVVMTSQCSSASEFQGEVWRSSYVTNQPHPNWNEGHGFKLPNENDDNKINLAVTMWDLPSKELSPERIYPTGKNVIKNINVDPLVRSESGRANQAYLNGEHVGQTKAAITKSLKDGEAGTVQLCDGQTLEFSLSCGRAARVVFTPAFELNNKDCGQPGMFFWNVTTSARGKVSKIAIQKGGGMQTRPEFVPHGRHRVFLGLEENKMESHTSHSPCCIAVKLLQVASFVSEQQGNQWVKKQMTGVCHFPLRVTVPLDEKNEQAVVVELEWAEREKPGSAVGELKKPLGAMSSAVESFSAKLAHYAEQVSHRVQADSHEKKSLESHEVGIDYKSLSGRFMARFQTAAVRSEVWGQGLKRSPADSPKYGCGHPSQVAASMQLPTDPAEVEKRTLALKKILQQIVAKLKGNSLDDNGKKQYRHVQDIIEQQLAALQHGESEVVFHMGIPVAQVEKIMANGPHGGSTKRVCANSAYCSMHQGTCYSNPEPRMPCSNKIHVEQCEKEKRRNAKGEMEPVLCWSKRTQRCRARQYECMWDFLDAKTNKPLPGLSKSQQDACLKLAAEDNTKAMTTNSLMISKREKRWTFSRTLKDSWAYLDEKSRWFEYKMAGYPCTTISYLADDDRVVDFAHALEAHVVDTENPLKELSWIAEVATSIANLFIRTVGDVQAIFNIYFTGHPYWDGSCLTVRPEFQTLFEHGHSTARVFGTQETPSQHYVNYRMKQMEEDEVYPGSTVKEPYGRRVMQDPAKLSTDENPWCKRSWASESRLQAERQSFAHRDVPTGRSTKFRDRVNERGTTMMPQFWCEALTKFLTMQEEAELKEKRARAQSPQAGHKPPGRPQTPFPKRHSDVDRVKGWQIDFRSSCSQLWYDERDYHEDHTRNLYKKHEADLRGETDDDEVGVENVTLEERGVPRTMSRQSSMTSQSSMNSRSMRRMPSKSSLNGRAQPQGTSQDAKKKKKKKEAKKEGVFTVWRRYDCESVLITSHFAHFFPKLVEVIEQFHKDIGFKLENVLLCAGRIHDREFRVSERRQKRTQLEEMVDTKCTMSKMLRYFGSDIDSEKLKQKMKWYVDSGNAWIRLMLRDMREWLRQLSWMEEEIMNDFNYLFGHGETLTGHALRSDVIARVEKEFTKDIDPNDKPLLRAGWKIRSDKMQDHLVKAAFIKQGQKGTLFPPPVKYETTLTFPGFLPSVSSQKRDICRPNIPAGLKLTGKFKSTGRTWVSEEAVEYTTKCWAGEFAPFPGFLLDFEGCKKTAKKKKENVQLRRGDTVEIYGLTTVSRLTGKIEAHPCNEHTGTLMGRRNNLWNVKLTVLDTHGRAMASEKGLNKEATDRCRQTGVEDLPDEKLIRQDEDAEWTKDDPSSEEESTVLTYGFGLRSILHVDDLTKKLEEKLVQLLAPKKLFNDEEMKGDGTQQSVAWNLGVKLLKEGAKTLTGRLAGLNNSFGVGEAMTNVGTEVGKWAGVLKDTVIKELKEKFKDAIKGVLEFLKMHQYKILDVHITFKKVGKSEFEPTFSVVYKVVQSMDVFMDIPLLGDMHGSLQASQRYDLSQIFSEIYNGIKDEQEEDVFQRCTRCFARDMLRSKDVLKKFCWHRGRWEDSRCVPFGGDPCAKFDDEPGIHTTIMDALDCSQVDDARQGFG